MAYKAPVRLDINKLKKGSVFSDGFGRDDLEFIRKDDKFVYAFFHDKEIKIDFVARNLSENGYPSPRKITGEYAVGLPGERRAEKLNLVKRAYKDIRPFDLYLNYRTDKDTELLCLVPFSEYVLGPHQREQLAKRDYTKDLDFYLYVVANNNFVNKEYFRTNALKAENERQRLMLNIKNAENNLKKAHEELREFLGQK